MNKFLALFSLIFCPPLIANPKNDEEHKRDFPKDEPLEVIEVVSDRIEPLTKELKEDATAKTEVLSGDGLRKFGAQTLADAIRQAIGVDTQMFCANCGAKRISINGLRGEHTTILVDGFPMHSTVSSFYGIDAVPMIGIEKIEVHRGAGASLEVAESIGGAINLISQEPVRDSISFDFEQGSAGSRQTSILGSAVWQSGHLMLTVFDGFSPHWDIDDNHVAESPQRSTRAVSGQFKVDLGSHSRLSGRVSQSSLETIGGNTEGFKPNAYSPIQAETTDFDAGDVRLDYIGDIHRITELIEVKRSERALRWDLSLSNEASLAVMASQTTQNQDGIYSHAFDYNNEDKIDFASMTYRHLVGDHLLSLGVDYKDQRMTSFSQALYVDRSPPLSADNFVFYSRGVYLMDEWQVNSDVMINLALRTDQLDVRWRELGEELSEQVVAPRMLALVDHTEHISSRLAIGLGYRPPLTLFESEHGNSHDGFVVDIDEIERAESAVYAFSLNYPAWFSTWSAHYTKLKNMSYGIDRISQGLPILFVNADENFEIYAFDWFFGGKPSHDTEVQIGVERFLFSDSYAEKLPTAAIEFQASLDASLKHDWGQFDSQVTYVGPRNLARYGYDEHFNVYNTDVTSDQFGQVSEPKSTQVPGYVLAHLGYQLPLGSHFELKLRVTNLLDFTQTSWGDSPATWHWHETHAHFDNFHTWGPLQGREYVIGLRGSW
ncbi:TonB-dependent receptor plug domain-containing protein [Pseudobacteriovorax antillogorgiicola]|uniref:TonB dependent receptor n=1 Tax=Pseudobacteriovorax antillogorgiicola TaxID=1513793 RepID=A0A1Y6CK42_9BACT|nr:TonB-dependent receptor [Pseudobacteriovorax antillogorgiicola]TCS47606.1 TonB-dependent receptor-like protein [Pseudobacteriovorax antillogorgiicola]SMF60108.1 TonB dependent receptor [Pseudobacteriovorax antillogorgiicola]